MGANSTWVVFLRGSIAFAEERTIVTEAETAEEACKKALDSQDEMPPAQDDVWRVVKVEESTAIMVR